MVSGESIDESISLSDLSITLLAAEFDIHKLAPDATQLPDNFFAALRSEDELSVITPHGTEVCALESKPGWSCFRVEGPLDFTLVGILARISQCLAMAKISIFVVSSYLTDYILVSTKDVDYACQSLIQAGAHLTQE